MVSEKEAIDMLKEAEKDYENLTAQKFSSDDRFCSHMTIVNKFGSWSAGLNKIGSSSGIDCPVCGKHYEQLGSHWREECKYPKISDKKLDILKGCLMGDGSFRGNYRVQVGSITKEFLDYLKEKLGWLVTDVKLQCTATESYKKASSSFGEQNTTSPKNYSNFYYLASRKHPKINSMKKKWYSNGEKRFPDNLSLSKASAKMWYVCDGGLNFSSDRKTPTAQIGLVNEKNKREYLLSLFEEKGFSPTLSDYVLHFPSSETKNLLNWFGDSVPGFEYKFQQDREKYLLMKP